MVQTDAQTLDAALDEIARRIKQDMERERVSLLILPSGLARQMADVIQIGSAPHPHKVSQVLRDTADVQAEIRVQMDGATSKVIAGYIETGLIRKRAGAGNPDDFRIH